jgi:type IV secretion system protein VirB9
VRTYTALKNRVTAFLFAVSFSNLTANFFNRLARNQVAGSLARRQNNSCYVYPGAVVLLSMLLVSPALAYQTPKAAPGDSRVRFVAYDPANVVRIFGVFGYQTYILFSEGEAITDIGSGDADAWSIGIVQSKNGFFIKPKGDKATTNLTVVTNLHHYNFDLIHTGKGGQPYYMVRFTYPGDEAAKLAAKAEREKVNELLQLDEAGKQFNRDYWWDGSDSIKPVEAWDNGTFTYFRIPPGRDFPSVFVLNDEDAKIEETVNLHVEGNVLVVHKIAKRFILRLGNKATGVWNQAYTPVGVDLPGTISPLIKREVR